MFDLNGLTMKEVKERRKEFGRNEIIIRRNDNVRKYLLHIGSEPIYLLLSCSAIIYFVLGEQIDGLVMIAFVLFVIGIDIFQDVRTGNALKKLKDITTPKIEVIREGIKYQIPKEELVPGDLMLLKEGVKIPADGYLVSCNGLCIDESILTGEAIGVMKYVRNHMLKVLPEEADWIEGYTEEEHKDDYFRMDYCYTGTSVILGTGLVFVEKTGNNTQYGEIAAMIAKAPSEKTHLQKQMGQLAKKCTYFAAILFVLVSLVTYFNLSHYVLSERIIHSMLAGVVLALSLIPGEFPVILSVFFSMGALRLAKKNALIRRLSAVETLGAVSVLCMDKTGTITKNKMQVADVFIINRQESKFCRILALSCKKDTCDPVDQAILEYGDVLCKDCEAKREALIACELQGDLRPLKEYAFTNELRAMGLVWKDNDHTIIVAKGSPESILTLCLLTDKEKSDLEDRVLEYSKKGFRVIALADHSIGSLDPIPQSLTECKLYFRGMLALSDPPRDNVAESIKSCYEAGMRVVMITGDHPVTASSIASQVGIKNNEQVLTGDEISRLTLVELKEKVKECNIFARVLPINKMSIVKALQDNGEVVAMTGDGVNDSPAQKSADIGVAMGKYGSEVCREAADLILLDDNFNTILDSVKGGRRIYQNIIKTIGYVFAFHIPIALISLFAPMLGIGPEALLLLPLQIVLLELVMDPTVSVVLERQPPEQDIMKQHPRNPLEELLTRKLFFKSILQGVIIFLASFGIYYGLLHFNYPLELARTTGFTVLVLSNILLVLVNCSDKESVVKTINRIKKDFGIWIVNLIILSSLFIMIYSPLHDDLGFAPLNLYYLVVAFALSGIAVLWYEFVKLVNRRKQDYH